MNGSEQRFDVCFVFFTNLKTDARTLNLARTLIKNGFKVCAIAAGTNEEAEEFRIEGLVLFPIQYNNSLPYRKKLMYYLLHSRKYYSSAKADIYAGMDLYSFYLARKLAKKNNSKLFYDSREIYSALGPLAKQKTKQSFLAYMEKLFIKDVDSVIVSGELDAEYLRNYFGHNLPYHVIMNLPPYKEIQNTDYLRNKFDIDKDKIILLYQGMLLPGRGILPSLKSLIFDRRFVFVVYGEGPYKDTILAETKKLGLEDRVFVNGAVPYDDLHDITCSADIGLTLIEPISFSYKLALPNKLFEYCMAGIPSLISDLPAMRKINEKYDIGWLIGPNVHSPEIAVTIENILRSQKTYRENCKLAAKELNYEVQTKTILDLFTIGNKS